MQDNDFLYLCGGNRKSNCATTCGGKDKRFADNRNDRMKHTLQIVTLWNQNK